MKYDADTEKEMLKRYVRYEPSTGRFFRKEKLPGNGAKPAGTEVAGYVGPHGYLTAAFLGRKGRRYTFHRVAWMLTYGEWPDGMIDHKDRDKTNNRISNLRTVCPEDNAKNMSISSRNTSGISGVCWHKSRNKWFLQVNSGGRRVHSSYHDDLLSAVAARFAQLRKYGFNSTHGVQK